MPVDARIDAFIYSFRGIHGSLCKIRAHRFETITFNLNCLHL
jgi:hypothetical protein